MCMIGAGILLDTCINHFLCYNYTFFTLNSNMEFPIVKLEHLSHRYSIQWAIKDIDFEITKPGIYGLLGSNGAGKSTTMNIMCGVLKQTEGDVYIQGYT